MKRAWTGVLALLLATGAGLAQAETTAPPAGTAPAAAAPADKELESLRPMLPPAPAGFEWSLYRNVAFLRPAGWNTRTCPDVPEQKVYGAFAESPEEFSESRMFEHGFTIQVVTGFKAANKLPPSKGAILMIKPLADARPKTDLLMFDSGTSPLGPTTVFRYVDAPAGQTPIIVHKFYIADDAADVLYVLTYESPRDSWEANWKQFGTPLLSRMAVIPFLSPEAR